MGFQLSRPTTIKIVEPSLPTAQPVVEYHVHVEGGPAWLAILAQMPATHVCALSVAGGAVGAIAMCALTVFAAVIVQAMAMVAVVGVAAVIGLVMIAMMTKGQ